jgi:hypothetical protein
MMKPHSRIGICVRAVEVHEASLHPSNETSLTWCFHFFGTEVLHAIVVAASGNDEGAVFDLNTLGFMFREE